MHKFENTSVPSALHRACLSGSVDVAGLLLAAGADQEAFDGEHRTPAILAMQLNRREVVALLGVAGSRPTFEVFWAAHTGNSKALQRLLESGVAASFARSDGWSVMMSAAAAGRVDTALLLHAAGADINVQARFWWHYRCIVKMTRLCLCPWTVPAHSL